ncbi:MAG: aspartate aminotransferase family protein [Clostridiales bacterium]|jgi:predicted acetylornithine/succinylornithine family transaminase|nr:aspartate aminotransferase family protein [Clostridiales bacterium]
MKNNEFKDTSAIIDATEAAYVNVFKRQPVVLTRGKGCQVWDADGKEYVDFLAGIAVNILGHGDTGLARAIAAQAKNLIHVSNIYYTEPQAKLAKTLLEKSGFDKLFLCNSGAEAVEAAIKLARRHCQTRYKIVTAIHSFHGRTLATLTATGQEKYSAPYRPLPPGFSHVPFNDLTAMRDALTNGEVGAVLLEPIQGEGGINCPAPDYLPAVAKLCREKKVLLIFDEIQTGMGRTGKFFAHQVFGVQPDIAVLAKGLGGGVPIGAMLARGECAAAFKPGDHGSTFGGNPLACAAANYVLETLFEKNLIEKAAKTGIYFLKRLQKSAKQFKLEAVGIGLMLGLRLGVRYDGGQLVDKMREKGFLINCAGNNTLRFVPPLTVGKKEIDAMADALDTLLRTENN